MAGLFGLPPRSTREGDSLLSKKSKKSSAKATQSASVKGVGSLLERIATIRAMVARYLGDYEDRYDIVDTEQGLADYISYAIEQGKIAIDTETTSLEPITTTIAGVSVFVPGRNAAYIPINHVSYVTGMPIENNVPVEVVKGQLERLVAAKTKIYMFNAKFDVRVIWNQVKVKLPVYWDGYIAARLLNENEGDGNNGLKALHKKYCTGGQGDAFSFDDLFKGIPFTHIPLKTGYLYAARDAEITMELAEFQEPYLDVNNPLCIEAGLQDVSKVMFDIEMPLLPVLADMEDTGIAFDFELADELSKKYHKQLEEREANFYKLLGMYQEEIDAYCVKNPNHKLSNPISITSPTQLAILFYDILGEKPVDKDKPRGTGEDILLKLDHPLSKAILDYREVAKIISTYVDKMPEIVNERTGRVHCNYLQIGADTGRMASNNPNMQNIPSHNKDIRQMFVASPGYIMISSDFSAQEPRLTAHLSGDEKMIAAYKAGKDLYAEVASIAFKVPYEECLEFRADGTKNPDGKERRSKAKAIVLGTIYSKGVTAIGEDLHVSKKTAQEIYDKVMVSFPGLKRLMDSSQQMARDLGYVTTIWGRKRRLPNMQLQKYEFTMLEGEASPNFDPLAFDDDLEEFDPHDVPERLVKKYTRLMDNCWKRADREKIRAQAKAEGLSIVDNGGYIAEATRQCLNARIQGSAADQTKQAMVTAHNDPLLKSLGFRLMLSVHDELIGEAPRENAKAAGDRLAEIMVATAKDLKVPFKCDAEYSERWYGESIEF